MYIPVNRKESIIPLGVHGNPIQTASQHGNQTDGQIL